MLATAQMERAGLRQGKDLPTGGWSGLSGPDSWSSALLQFAHPTLAEMRRVYRGHRTGQQLTIFLPSQPPRPLLTGPRSRAHRQLKPCPHGPRRLCKKSPCTEGQQLIQNLMDLSSTERQIDNSPGQPCTHIWASRKAAGFSSHVPTLELYSLSVATTGNQWVQEHRPPRTARREHQTREVPASLGFFVARLQEADFQPMIQ